MFTMVKAETVFKGMDDFDPSVCHTDDLSLKSQKSSRIDGAS